MSDAIHSMSIRMGSVEELSLAMEGSVWKLDMRQLEVGKAAASIDAIATSSSLLTKTELEGRTHQRGDLARDRYTFGLPMQQQTLVIFGGRPVGGDTLTLFDSAGGLDCVSEPGFGAYTVSFCASEFETIADNLGLEISTFGTSNGNRHMRLPPECAQSLRKDLLETLCGATPKSPTEVAVQQSMDIELATGIAEAFFSSQDSVSDCYKNRARALRVALAYIYEHMDEPLTVERLCKVSACSISTLERAFRERFSVSPKRYLMAVRLSGVRKALLASGEDQCVGDIAAGMGFWHMSKMAADYKRMFGELPSQTRRAA